MTHNDIMVLAWPLIGVAAMCLFGWFMSGWINRKYPRAPATAAKLTKLSEHLALLQQDSTRHTLDIARIEALIEEKIRVDQSSPSRARQPLS